METPSKQHDVRYPAGEPSEGNPQTISYPNTQEMTLFRELLPIPQAITLPDRKIPVTEPNLVPLRTEQPRDGLPHLERYPAMPRFNLETTVVETLVPAMTLRAWERHYGIPTPLRNTNSYRQYSQRDLAAIKWLRWRIKRNDTSVHMAMAELARLEPAYVHQHDGQTLLEALTPPSLHKLDDLHDPLLHAITRMDEVSSSRLLRGAFATHPAAHVCQQLIQPILTKLVELRHTSSLPHAVQRFASKLTRAQIVQLIEAGMTPREALQRLSSLETQAPQIYAKQQRSRKRMQAIPPFERLIEVLLEAMARLDEAHAQSILDEAFFYYTVEDVCLNLLQPVLYRIGELWAARQITVTVEHLASNIIRTRLSYLFQTTPNLRQGPSILVGCAPQETHEIGILMLALFWRRAGLNIYYLGQMIECQSLLQEIRRFRPGLVCLSSTTRTSVRNLAEVAREIDKLDAPRPGVCFGGSIFAHEPGLTKTIKGTPLGSDALQTTQHIQELLRKTL